MLNPEALRERLPAALGLEEGHTPFPWQIRLLDQLLEGRLPSALDLPTGLAKTSTMAIWLLARAGGAPVPRRLVYIVDRRVVVDQATAEAERLRAFVAQDPALRTALGLEDGESLPVSTLRGQLIDNRAWLDDPAATAIVIGTVDMTGSRLLFQGYGTSSRMRPYQAGLLGCDGLLVLDEAHLVPPFEHLLVQVADRAAPHAPTPLRPPPLRLLSLSATGRDRAGAVFRLHREDHEHRVVRQRLHAPKHLRLETPGSTALAQALAERAWELSGQGALPVRVLVFTHSRQEAEDALTHLSALAGLDRQPQRADVELLVGARRVWERQTAAKRLKELGFIAGSPRTAERPAFLFATAAGEVGIDLDADHAVCDLVPWERMVQRLGRVNRRGQGEAEVRVLVAPLPAEATEPQKEQRAALLELLQRLPEGPEGSLEASPAALGEVQQLARAEAHVRALLERASTPLPLYPALPAATLEDWAMTSLPHHPGRAEVGPWLRGWVEDEAQTTVVWRQHLPVDEEGREADAKAFFEAAPVHTSERLETEAWRVADWLDRRLKAWWKVARERKPDPARELEVLAYLCTDGDTPPTPLTVRRLLELPKRELTERLLPGATLVVRAELGGLREGLLDAKARGSDTPGEDRAALPPTGEHNYGVVWGPEAPPVVPFRVRLCDSADSTQDPGWHERQRFPLAFSPEGEVLRWRVVDKWGTDGATEDDRSSGRPQLLEEHQTWAAQRAQRVVRRLGLPPAEADWLGRVLTVAARRHDEGKRSRTWQLAFSAPRDGVYGKTRGPVRTALLGGYRHELGSLPLLEQDPAFRALPPEDQDLVLHLVASHHGFARPVLRTDGADEPPSRLRQRAQEIALRFVRLQERWGPWGLAWLEALLRAADQQASRDNDRRETAGKEG